MARRPDVDLAAAVHGAAQPARPGIAPAHPFDTQAAEPPARPKKRAREGTKGIVIYTPLAISRELRRLALDTDTTLQAMGLEALEMILQRHGRHPGKSQ